MSRAAAASACLLALASAGAVRGDDDPWLSPLVAAPPMDDRPVPRQAPEQRAGRAARAAESPPTGSPPAAGTTPAAPAASRAARGGWLRTGLSLAGVVALILAVGYGSRRIQRIGRSRRPGVIEIVSRTSLSPRQSLALVRVGPRLVLIGATPERISRLDVYDDPELTAALAGAAQRERPDSHTAEFRRRLHHAERELGDAGDRPAEPAREPDASQWSQVRQRLAQALERLESRRPA